MFHGITLFDGLHFMVLHCLMDKYLLKELLRLLFLKQRRRGRLLLQNKEEAEC